MVQRRVARATALELLASIRRKALDIQSGLKAKSTKIVYVSLPPVRKVGLDGKEHNYAQSTTRPREQSEYPDNSVNEMRRLYWQAVELRNLAITLMETASNRLSELEDPDGHVAAPVARRAAGGQR